MTGLTIAVRAAHLGALTLLLGAFAFLLLVARPAFARAGVGGGPALTRFDRLARRLAGWSLCVAFGASLLGLWAQLATVTGRPLGQAFTPEALARLLAETRFGHVWLTRLGLMALLGWALLLASRARGERAWWELRLAGAGLGAGLLVAGAFAGHAGAASDQALLAWQLTADAAHLLAAGVWLGGLPLLALLLAGARRAGDPASEAVAAEATRRFSALGLAAVSLLVFTGLASAWALVGSLPALVGTPYGRLLLLKLSLLAPLMGLAAANLLREKPGLSASVAEPRRARTHDVLGRLRRNVVAEAALGGAILLVVGSLGVTPPALHVEPTWPFSFRLSWGALDTLPAAIRPAIERRLLFGIDAVLLALLALAYAAVFPRHRPLAAALGVAGLALGVVAAWAARDFVTIDAYPTTYLRPAVPYHALSIANGLGLYRQHCAACHGPAGHGDGPAAAGLPARPADLTAGHTADHTAGDLFWWLTHGIPRSGMPGFGDRLSEEERWDLVNAVRALADSDVAGALGPAPSPAPRLVAPDLAYTTAAGEAGALKDFRGRAVVLLVLFTVPGSGERLGKLSDAYERLRRAGGDVLAVPLAADHVGSHLPPGPPVPFPVVVDGASEGTATFTLLRRGRAIPHHMELLVDRQGYLRARWTPGERDGWSDIDRLVGVVEGLAKEPSRAPAAEEHVH